MSAYADLLGRLFAARRFGIVLGLERMRGLLDRLGAPDRRLGTVLHVGGTNGKGSTVAMVAALAARGGARVATYTSPHLTTVRERIVIDGEMITEAAMVSAADRVRAAGGDELTFFEQITAIACVAIAGAGVDVTVLEVGLGGRLDATNAIDAQVAVITGVAMDHEAILGTTIAAIAAEKAGIIKPGQRVVIGRSGDPAARPVLLAAAQRAGAVVTVIDHAAVERVPPLAMGGEHQRRNAATALAALDHLEAQGVVHVAAEGRAAALGAVTMPGRQEWLTTEQPAIILDGAHNPDGAATLDDMMIALEETYPDGFTLIVGVSADKDVRGMIGQLTAQPSTVIATRYQGERALAPEALAAVVAEVRPGLVAQIAPDLAAAVALARPIGRPIVIAGSLFLVGEARALLLGAPVDPVRVSDPAPPRS